MKGKLNIDIHRSCVLCQKLCPYLSFLSIPRLSLSLSLPNHGAVYELLILFLQIQTVTSNVYL